MRGVVYLAGSKRYFVNAYASIKMLRHLGCTLPVEWFYLGEEMRPEWVALVENIGDVKCIDLGGGDTNNAKANGGWQNKITAILESSFTEVLFLDADNFAWRDPEYLFESTEYKETGTLLWKDISDWRPEQNPVLENYFGCVPTTRECCESGQLLFDKSRCIKALNKTKEYNLDSANAYKIVYGDKDTFYFGFVSTNTPFHFIEKRPKCEIGCLQQYDPHGNNIVFSHLTGGKWALNGRPFITNKSYPHVKECSGYIKELRELLTNK